MGHSKQSSHHHRSYHCEEGSRKLITSSSRPRESRRHDYISHKKIKQEAECPKDLNTDKPFKKVKLEPQSPARSCHRHRSEILFLKRGREEADSVEDRIPGPSKSSKEDDFAELHVDDAFHSKSLCQDDSKKQVEKERPNFHPSGKLVEDTNMYKGVVIKYNEPQDAQIPKTYWRLYPFKGDEALPIMHIHRQSAYLIGRDHVIADIAVLHPSCSKQHAVLQYRLTPIDSSDGTSRKKVRPYIIDLNSANGTFLNDERIEPQRFVELREKDVLKFGFSSREYVLLRVKEEEKKK